MNHGRVARIRARKCRCCGRWYTPRAQNASRQRYCSLAPCRRASHRASHRKWLRRNAGWHAGAANVQRVRSWRQAHPGYRVRATRRERLLIRITITRPRDGRPRFGMRIENPHSGALRDFRLLQRYPGQSLAAQLNRALRDTRARAPTIRYRSPCKTHRSAFPPLRWLEPLQE